MSFPFPTTNSQIPTGFTVMNRVPMAPPLYVGNLDESIHDEVLYDFFSKFGPIHFVRIMRDPATGKSRGFGFVNFILPRDAETARQFAQYERIGRKNIRILFKRNIRDLPSDANIYVKNLDPHVSVKELHNHFSQVGPVLSAKVSSNAAGESLGYGYVQFEKKEDAEAAIDTLQGSKLKETNLQLEKFLPKDRRGPTGSRRNLYVKNLPSSKPENELNQIVKEIFSKYGEIETMLVKKHPTESKFSAFVCYKTEEAANKALNEINENKINLPGADEPLYVNFHQNRAERDRELKKAYSQSHNDNNLFVKNLKSEVTELDLKTAFTEFGPVLSVAVKSSTLGDKIAKYGFIAFTNASDAKKAQLEGPLSAEVKKLYIAGPQPYISFHQTRERRNEFLYTQRRRRMQPGMMALPPGPFPMTANRRFPPFPQFPNAGFRPTGPRGDKQIGRGERTHIPRGGRGGRHAFPQGQRVQHAKKPVQTKGQIPAKVENGKVLPAEEDSSAITVQNLKTKIQEFLALDTDKQRQILGELLFPLIKARAGETIAPKITGMLIDLSVLEVSEILEFLENPELLDERVNEAKALILEESYPQL